VKTFIIDINALISFVTDRSVDQQRQIKEIFESAALLKSRVCCPQNVITEFVYVMEKVYHVEPIRIQEMIHDLLNMAGFEIVHDLDYRILFSLWPDTIKDFEDAIVAVLCMEIKGSIVATFDVKLIAFLKTLGITTLSSPN